MSSFTRGPAGPGGGGSNNGPQPHIDPVFLGGDLLSVWVFIVYHKRNSRPVSCMELHDYLLYRRCRLIWALIVVIYFAM
ncbi:MAG TPA: hypothetical protein VJ729_15740 [Nitrososphaeraceae archaeon]|nr:hypothetical protein [Nitrososphaeraceae archaeon]